MWFAVMNPGRIWLFKCLNLEELERWICSMEGRCNDFKQTVGAIMQDILKLEKVHSLCGFTRRCLTCAQAFAMDPFPIRYNMHRLPEKVYPTLQRAAIPGRPMSGSFSSEDPIKVSVSLLSCFLTPPALSLHYSGARQRTPAGERAPAWHLRGWQLEARGGCGSRKEISSQA